MLIVIECVAAECSVGGQELGRAAWVEFEREPGRIHIKRVSEPGGGIFS